MKTKLRADSLACLERAEAELAWFSKKNRTNNLMDFESLNQGPIRMDWDKLFKAPPLDFAHDNGIHRHMDRSSYPGKLGGQFLPRCAK